MGDSPKPETTQETSIGSDISKVASDIWGLVVDANNLQTKVETKVATVAIGAGVELYQENKDIIDPQIAAAQKIFHEVASTPQDMINHFQKKPMTAALETILPTLLCPVVPPGAVLVADAKLRSSTS